MAKQIAAVIQWTKSVSANTRVIQTEVLSPDTQQGGHLGALAVMNLSMELILKVFLESS
jgi:hypothetical protein